MVRLNKERASHGRNWEFRVGGVKGGGAAHSSPLYSHIASHYIHTVFILLHPSHWRCTGPGEEGGRGAQARAIGASEHGQQVRLPEIEAQLPHALGGQGLAVSGRSMALHMVQLYEPSRCTQYREGKVSL